MESVLYNKHYTDILKKNVSRSDMFLALKAFRKVNDTETLGLVYFWVISHIIS